MASCSSGVHSKSLNAIFITEDDILGFSPPSKARRVKNRRTLRTIHGRSIPGSNKPSRVRYLVHHVEKKFPGEGKISKTSSVEIQICSREYFSKLYSLVL